MPRIALVTYQGNPELTASDHLLIEPLAKHGIQAVAAPWNDPAVDWTQFEAAVLRSTWDYHHQIETFRQWLDRIERAGLRLINPYPLVRWNMDKIYLRDLQQQAVPIIPTIWGTENSELELPSIMAEQGWDQVIVKPRYGASAEGAQIVSRAYARPISDRQPMSLANHFIQPIMPQVLNGEYSVIFFGGEYAYTVLKRPADGQIFVQKEHGGSEELITPPGSLVTQAADILQAAGRVVPASPLYARVDGLMDGEQFLLMELELIEPDLFLKYHPAAPERFAKTIADGVIEGGPADPPRGMH